jgi:hypothetical protein
LCDAANDRIPVFRALTHQSATASMLR